MKKIYQFTGCTLFAIVAIQLGSSAQSTTFGIPGTYTYTVPVGVTALIVDMKGGKGGDATSGPLGGGGGRVQCNLAAATGCVLNIIVGGAGADGVAGTSVAEGYNNAGAVGGYCNAPSLAIYSGGGGGGASEICLGGTALANRVIVAGGGGGAGNNCANPGGAGGGLIGATADTCSAEYSGTGGTQITFGLGGTYGTYGTSANGSSRYGGAASTFPAMNPGSAGGGGGGGYYGGGGGSWGGGGGGSSFTDPVLVSAPVHGRGYNTSGDGGVNLTFVCETPLAGTIIGNTPLCTGANTIALTDPTGSSYGSWSSSNPSIAAIGSTGVVTSGAAGVATITYSTVTPCGTSATATVIVTVNPIPDPGTISGTDSACPGNTVNLSSSAPGGIWTSNNTAISIVNPSSGMVTAISTGIDTILYTVTVSGCTVATKIPFTVRSAVSCIEGMNVVNTDNGSLTIMPNPNNGVFTANLHSELDEPIRFIVTDMLGAKIYEVLGKTNTETTIQINMAYGIYFLNAITPRDKKSAKVMILR